MTKKQVLVLGGAGFLGSNLISQLLLNGHSVTCLDNFTTGNPKNIEPFWQSTNFTFIEHDVRTPFSLECDVIINLASPASPPRYQMNPVGTLMTNVSGTFNALELAREKKARYIQASTSEVYGNPAVHPQVETYWGNVNPIGRRSCYDEGKRAAETLCEDFRRQYKMDVLIFRIFNTYGPGMLRDDGRVVSNFIVQALEGRNITIYGDGTQTRSFCFVDDLIRAFITAVESKEHIVGPINIGHPDEVNLNLLATKIISLTYSNSSLVYDLLPSDDPVKRNPDITKARKHLGWVPEVSLEEGLVKTIQYFAGQT